MRNRDGSGWLQWCEERGNNWARCSFLHTWRPWLFWRGEGEASGRTAFFWLTSFASLSLRAVHLPSSAVHRRI